MDRTRTSWYAPAFAATLLAASGCGSSDRPALEQTVVQLDEEERASYERTIESLKQEVSAAHDRLAQLEAAAIDAELGIDDGSALDRCDAEAKLLRQEVERLRAGLQGAVAELNRQPPAPTPRPQAPPSSPAASTAATTRKEYGNVSPYSGPRVHLYPTEIHVDGKLYSSRDSDTPVQITMKLLEDERGVTSEAQRVTVPAHGNREYYFRFRLRPRSEAVYTAEVSLDY